MRVPLILMGILAVATASTWPKGVDLPTGTPVDEAYRLEFGNCDANDQFADMPSTGAGTTPTR